MLTATLVVEFIGGGVLMEGSVRGESLVKGLEYAGKTFRPGNTASALVTGLESKSDFVLLSPRLFNILTR